MVWAPKPAGTGGQSPIYSHGDGWNVFPYSPLLAAQFAPWSALSDGVGSALWHSLVGGVFLLALVWWSRTALPAGSAALRRPLLWLLVMPSAATTILSGQMGGVVAAAILLSVAAVAEERWNLSAAAAQVGRGAMECYQKRSREFAQYTQQGG